MRVLVLGAGVVGTTTAYHLARDGHAVTVLEAREGTGLETSFANGGQISASHAEPWASPRTVLKALKWLGRADAPLYFPWWRLDPALWGWLARFLGNCAPGRVEPNLERVLRVALYSRARIKALRAETGISYDARSRGILHFYRDAAEFDHARAANAAMAHHGLNRRVLAPDECVALEPSLAHMDGTLAGGLYSPDDESGDAHAFTREMERLARAAGAEFRFGVRTTGLTSRGGRVTGAATDAGTIEADVVVLALGCGSPAIARTVGLRLPIYPGKGYSMTLVVEGEDDRAPFVSLTDDENKLVVSRLGNRLRIAGTAELSGWSADITPRAEVVRAKAARLFPKAGDWTTAEPWAGLRPVTPDSVPLLGPAPIDGLILNTGHGTLGWTMAAGSAQVVADLVAGRAPEISLEGLGATRRG